MPQFDILKPYLSDRITSLVRCRLLDGVKFFIDGVLSKEFSRSEVKLSLLLVKIANPDECFTADELHILGGRQKNKPSAKPLSSSAVQPKSSASKNQK